MLSIRICPVKRISDKFLTQSEKTKGLKAADYFLRVVAPQNSEASPTMRITTGIIRLVGLNSALLKAKATTASHISPTKAMIPPAIILNIDVS